MRRAGVTILHIQIIHISAQEFIMTITSITALIFAVFIFTAIPGPGVMSIIAQSVSRGFRYAALWTIGILIGDLIYLMMAVFGMSIVARQMGAGFMILKWIGAAYLIYLGVKCWITPPPETDREKLPDNRGLLRTFLAAASLSLSNPKLIAFYCGFLPGFVNLHELSVSGVIMLVFTIISTALAVLLSYAWIGDKGRSVIRSPKVWKTANRCAGSVLIGSGVAVISEQ